VECEFLKSNVGLIPADEITQAWFSKVKAGRIVRGEFVLPRNPHFHRKFMALMKVGFDYFEEISPRQMHKGKEIKPDFERFRKDITILAGKYHMVVNIKGEVRAEADSIRFASMEEPEFQMLYENVLEVLLQRVLTGPQWSKEKVDKTVEQIAGFIS
jgi:hypothetical protein